MVRPRGAGLEEEDHEFVDWFQRQLRTDYAVPAEYRIAIQGMLLDWEHLGRPSNVAGHRKAAHVLAWYLYRQRPGWQTRWAV